MPSSAERRSNSTAPASPGRCCRGCHRLPSAGTCLSRLRSSAGSRARSGPVRAAAGAVLGGVELDLLLANLAADGLRLGAELDPLDRDGLGTDHGPLRVQGDLVLLRGDRRADVGVAAVGAGDRLAL